jgi:hypothetical protein
MEGTMARWLIGILALVTLTACGNTRTERGLSGGAIGAGVGAAAGEVFGDSPGKGALLGGAAGAATGILTTDDDDDNDGRGRGYRGYDEDDCYYDRSRQRYYCDRD